VTLNRTRSTLVIAFAMVAMLAMSVTAAFAQQVYPPASAYGVACTVSGNTVACAVVGAQAGEQLAVTATCAGTVVYRETVTADADGEAAFSFAARGAAACDVSVLGAASGTAATNISIADNAAPEAGQALDRAAPGERRALPFTGSEVTIFLAVGLGLVALGTFAVRRRGADA
jgi:LPXTG-motif cell wall-anchored protein